ncbi:hypothetical protein [Actinacidiphila soli]|uniref:hypothetical protein n=1 Tax=Actinacidiphila soli TaxID=2487275 RepID=UPI000FCA267D|nr:hypothetical protein [Actinacidiphila soli]
MGTGLAVANIYYSQPLLAPIGSGFGVSQGSTTLVVSPSRNSDTPLAWLSCCRWVTSIFLGGAVATAVSGVVNDRYGWTGVSLVGAALALIGVCVWAVSTLSQVRAEAAAGREIAA